MLRSDEKADHKLYSFNQSILCLECHFRNGVLVGIGALGIGAQTILGGGLLDRGAYRKEGTKSSHYGNSVKAIRVSHFSFTFSTSSLSRFLSRHHRRTKVVKTGFL